LKYILLIISTIFFLNLSSQNLIFGEYYGYWAQTSWRFNFNKDSTFTRTSEGHYGYTKINGKFKIVKDTLLIIEGFKDTDGTISEYYLIDGDSCIIDIDGKYDYCNINKKAEFIQLGNKVIELKGSRLRNISFPQKESDNRDILKNTKEIILNIIDSLNAFNFIKAKNILIKNYFELNELHFNLKNNNYNIHFTNNSYQIKKCSKANYIEFLSFYLGVKYGSIDLIIKSKEIDEYVVFIIDITSPKWKIIRTYKN